MGIHRAVETYAINPPVVRCACGDKVVVRRPGMWKEHLATGAHGEPYPWPEDTEPEDCCEIARETGAIGPGFAHDHDCENYDGAPRYRDGMGPGDPVRCDND